MFAVDFEARDLYKQYVRFILLEDDERWRLGGIDSKKIISSLRDRPARELIRFSEYISSKIEGRVRRADYEKAVPLKRLRINFDVHILHETPKGDYVYYLRRLG